MWAITRSTRSYGHALGTEKEEISFRAQWESLEGLG